MKRLLVQFAIVRDGGVYEQLFLLKGVSSIAHSVVQGVNLSLADLDLSGLSGLGVDLFQGTHYLHYL